MITENVGDVTKIHHWAAFYVIGLKQRKVIEGGIIIVLTSHKQKFLTRDFQIGRSLHEEICVHHK
jgi:hypothetical protein